MSSNASESLSALGARLRVRAASLTTSTHASPRWCLFGAAGSIRAPLTPVPCQLLIEGADGASAILADAGVSLRIEGDGLLDFERGDDWGSLTPIQKIESQVRAINASMGIAALTEDWLICLHVLPDHTGSFEDFEFMVREARGENRGGVWTPFGTMAIGRNIVADIPAD